MLQERVRVWVGWYYRLGERKVGPVPRNRIAQLIADGHLQRSEKVWKAWNQGDEFRLDQAEAGEAMRDEPGKPPGLRYSTPVN